MKVPVPPPDFSALQGEIAKDPANLARIVMQVSPFGSLPEYLPWDKLRHKTPPEGLTSEQWWYGLKLGRTMMMRALPLRDKEDVEFKYALPDRVLRLTEEISRLASGQIAISEQVTSPAMRDRYIISSLIEEAITSSQLEGAATSRQVAKEMIRSGRPARDKSEQMILNNFTAMRHVSQIRDRELTPELICEIHEVVTRDTLDDPLQAGRIQSSPDPSDRILVYGGPGQVIHRPPPVDQLQKRMVGLCRFANGTADNTYIHPVLRALTLHFMMGYDHYFEDGNGRTARVLFYWCMLHEGYWLTEFLTISRILKNAPAQYARSFMLTEQDGGDLTYFFLYHLEVIRRAIGDLDAYLTRKVQELQQTRLLLAATPGEFNHRQLALLELALRDSSSVFTVQSHGTSHNVSPETARQDLGDLTNRGLLARIRQGKKFVWRPAEGIADRIQASHAWVGL
jgi:Fic family protein